MLTSPLRFALMLAGASACTGVLGEPLLDPTRETVEATYVFVSSETHGGVFGGLAGADALCMRLATAARLPGETYRAWMSTVDLAAADRLTHSAVPYKLIDGTTVAADWDDLTDGALDHPIGLDERGRSVDGSAWTFTLHTGERPAWSPTDDPMRNPRRDCGGWLDHGVGGTGVTSARAPVWTDGDGAASCDTELHVYCVEQ